MQDAGPVSISYANCDFRLTISDASLKLESIPDAAAKLESIQDARGWALTPKSVILLMNY
jgi:hypothetical protein